MKTHFIDEETPYTGEELANHWIYRNVGILGDAVVAFVGPSHVDIEHMVDLEDVLNNDQIISSRMLNFIIEIFNVPLLEGVLVQRLFTAILHNKVMDAAGNVNLKRIGDDLFLDDTMKLSVSICTKSPTSILIHTGLNVQSQGAPVEAAGLTSELGIDAIKPFALSCMKALADEWSDIHRSCCKVKAVGAAS